MGAGAAAAGAGAGRAGFLGAGAAGAAFFAPRITELPPVPAIFGMDYQSVSTGEIVNGYVHPDFTPTAPLGKALDYVDSTLGRMEATLRATGVADETLIIVTAKHGQGPVEGWTRKIVADTVLQTQIDSVAPNLLAGSTLDDIGLAFTMGNLRNVCTAAAAINGM